jgi:hypothetical protein
MEFINLMVSDFESVALIGEVLDYLMMGGFDYLVVRDIGSVALVGQVIN